MKLRLSHINTILLIAIVCINGYIVVMPVLPAVTFWLSKDTATVTALTQRVEGKQSTPAPPEDSLVIPSMELNEPVHAGRTAKTLRQGLWLRPQGTTPDKGGNTVIAGHRFTYTDPQASLYHLDKVRIGERIALFWEGKRYTYTVTETKVVKARQTAIENPTTDARLTIYTCTPLWLPKDRLVVVAERTTPYER